LPARELRFAGHIGMADGELGITVLASGVEVSSELIDALPGAWRTELRGAEFSGRADATVEVHRAGGGPLNWSAGVRLDRGRFKHPMLPEPVTEIKLAARATPNQLMLERLDATFGSAAIALAAERSGWSQQAPMALSAKIVGLRLDDRSAAMFPESLLSIWQRFRPQGYVDADVRLEFDGRHWRPQLLVDCRDVSLTDAKAFPYTLEQSTGRVEYHPETAAGPDRLLLNLTGVGGGQPVRVSAELTQLCASDARATAISHPVGWVEIAASDVPLHS
jgi:hypothetical protein